MASQSIILPRAVRRDGAIQRIANILAALPMEKPWKVTIEEAKPLRSGQQNKLLWALYGQVIDKGGEAMRGWHKEEIHDFMLGEWSGWEKVTMFGRVKMRPILRSSKLDKQQFSDLVAFIANFMSEQGVFLELPEGDWR